MPHPGVTVTSRAGTTSTGTAPVTGRFFIVGVTTTGPSSPQRVTSLPGFTDIFGARPTASPQLYDSVDLFLRSGGAEVWVARGIPGQGQDIDDVATGALAQFPASLGPGQVAVPGSSDPAVHAALINHAAAMNRAALLDAADDTATAVVAAAAALRTASLVEEVSSLWAGAVQVPGIDGGANRVVPASAAAAARVAATDAYLRHSGGAPIFTQGRNAGVIDYGIGVTRSYTDSEWDSLTAAGVNLIGIGPDGEVELQGFRSVSTDPRWVQFNYHRLRMGIVAGSRSVLRQFVGRTITPRLLSEARAALLGYMTGLYQQEAFYGATAADAFDVDTASVNTPATAAAAQLNAEVSWVPGPFAETVNSALISQSLVA